LEWEWSEFWSLDREVNVLQLSSTWHKASVNSPELELISQHNTFFSTVELRDRIWASSEPVWMNDAVENIPFLHTAFGFPIKCGSEIIGVMTFFSSKIHEEQPDLLTMMVAVGSQIGQFILRCQAETALRESEERFQNFMNNSPVVAFMKDSQGCYVYINKTCERVFNIKQSDLACKTDFDWLPEQTAKQVRENDILGSTVG
jgi:PAS domain-containing protein